MSSEWEAQLVLLRHGPPGMDFPRIVNLNEVFEGAGTEKVLIGRQQGADMRFPLRETPVEGAVPMVMISRKHCWIARRKSDDTTSPLPVFELQDNQSANGTFLNSTKLGSEPVRLNPGDQLGFGFGSKLEAGDPLPEENAVIFRFLVQPRPMANSTNDNNIEPSESTRVSFCCPAALQQYSQVSYHSFSQQEAEAKPKVEAVAVAVALTISSVAAVTTLSQPPSLSSVSNLTLFSSTFIATTPIPSSTPAGSSSDSDIFSEDLITLPKQPGDCPQHQPKNSFLFKKSCIKKRGPQEEEGAGAPASAGKKSKKSSNPPPPPTPKRGGTPGRRRLLSSAKAAMINELVDDDPLGAHSAQLSSTPPAKEETKKQQIRAPSPNFNDGDDEDEIVEEQQQMPPVPPGHLEAPSEPPQKKQKQEQDQEQKMLEKPLTTHQFDFDVAQVLAVTPQQSKKSKKPAHERDPPPTEALGRAKKLCQPKEKENVGVSRLPAIRTGFDLLCSDMREGMKGKGKEATRRLLIKAWRELDVAGKEAYEKRAAAEKEELVKKYPELALLNPNQDDELKRAIAGGVLQTPGRRSRGKAEESEKRAMMRAARARLFEDVDKSDEVTRAFIVEAEEQQQQQSVPDSIVTSSASSANDAFEVDTKNLQGLLTKDGAPVSSRLLGTTKSNTVYVLPRNITSVLKRHQLKGVQFLWKTLVSLPEAVAATNTTQKLPGGCIIAHGMGLGKTLTTVAFSLMWLRAGKGCRILVVAPKSTLRQWEREIEEWCEKMRHEAPPVFLVEGTKQGEKVKEWEKEGGILLASYAVYVRLVTIDENRGQMQEQAQQQQLDQENEEVRQIIRASQFVTEDDEAEEAEVEKAAVEEKTANEKQALSGIADILKEKTDLVVVDEGHKIASPNSALTRCLHKLSTLNRVVLTGTPMQNSMKQYHTMLDFVRPGSWTAPELSDLYLRASRDASARAELAQNMSSLIQRYDCRVLRDELPPLIEYVIYTNSSPMQRDLYSQVMSAQGGDQSARVKASKALALGGTLLKVCMHTNLLRDYCISKGVVGPEMDKESKSAKRKGTKRKVLDESGCINSQMEEAVRQGTALYDRNGADMSWALPVFKAGYPGRDNALSHNPKAEVLLEIIQKTASFSLKSSEKLAVFSESAAMLDVVERYLLSMQLPKNRKWTNPRKKASGGWRKGVEYHRLDGSCTLPKRQAMCDDFNNPKSRSLVFLISTRAGGLGLNLVGATRVVLYGASWNPQSELQAIYRTYRYGQTKPVTVYRLISQGTIEQTMFARGVAKMQMSTQFVDDRWTRADLKSFDVLGPTDWSHHAQKDAVLQHLQERAGSKVHSVLLHDSLRVSLDAVEEQMSDEEEDEEVEALLLPPPLEPDAEEEGSESSDGQVSPLLVEPMQQKLPVNPANRTSRARRPLLVPSSDEGECQAPDSEASSDSSEINIVFGEPLHSKAEETASQEV